jgi:hypothetical protein
MNSISKVVAALPTIERLKLLELWHCHFGRFAPAGIRRELMVPMLAYRIQEKAYGGLKKETIRKLRKLAQESNQNPRRALRANGLKTGTRLIGRWHGQAYEVEVVRGGFLCRGTISKSLSEIARRITGTQWSGPRFFGLRKNCKSGRGA